MMNTTQTKPPFDEWHRSQASKAEVVEMKDSIMEVVNFGNYFPEDKIVVKNGRVM